LPPEIRYRLRNIMFTGIIEHLGAVSHLQAGPAGGRISVHAPSLTPLLQISASVAVNGCCLTVVGKDAETFSADLSRETLEKTSFSSMKVDSRVNLEQPLAAGKEFGGHFVLGHVDGAGRVVHLKRDGEGWSFAVEVPSEVARYVVSKGSITIDGVSLTIARWINHVAEIAVIPYTYEHTNIRDRVAGDAVNLEADILGKYIERYLQQRDEAKSDGALNLAELVRQGF
jgi:riboflavin synthase